VMAALVAGWGLPISADWPVTEKLDLDAIYKIKEEGLQRSKVMEIESYLTDVYGPRLTNSPYYREAGDWGRGHRGDQQRERSRRVPRQAARQVRALAGAARGRAADDGARSSLLG